MRSKGVGLVLIVAIGIIDERAFQFSPEHEISVVSAVLKKYCRELPEPIFYFPLADRIRYTENRGKCNSCRLDLAVTDFGRVLYSAKSESHISSNFSAIRARLSRMPPIHQSTLRVIVEHLSRVAAHSTQNKMDAKVRHASIHHPHPLESDSTCFPTRTWP
jgi:hypothetical protein